MRLIADVVRSIFVAGIAVGVSLAPPIADAKESLVAVGEVSSSVVRSDVDVSGALRTAVAEELPSIDLSRAKARPMILSVSLVRMDTESTPQGPSTTCVISAALRTKKGGNLFALLEGRAITSDQTAALRGAVQGAFKRIPEALAQ